MVYGKNKLSFKQILADPILFLAFGFGSGLVKKAPGTCGTLAAIPLYLIAIQFNSLIYIGLVVSVVVSGIWICQYAADKLGTDDFGGIVWDEIAGYLLTMCFIPFSWKAALSGFILFRLLDIVKPWPIGLIDQQIHGGLGIMLDDILAAFYAAGLLALLDILNWN